MAKNKTESEFDIDNSEMEDQAGASFENNEEGLLVDLSGVEKQTFDAIPAGTYEGIIEDATYALSKSSGKPMWNIKIAVTTDGYENRKLFTFFSFSEKALPGTKGNLEFVAPELLSGPFNPKDETILGTLVGKNVKFKVKIEKYNGEDQNRVQRFMATGGDDGFIS